MSDWIDSRVTEEAEDRVTQDNNLRVLEESPLLGMGELIFRLLSRPIERRPLWRVRVPEAL